MPGTDSTGWRAGTYKWQDADGGGGAPAASAVTYDNGESGLEATDVQAAIDEVAASPGGGGGAGGQYVRVTTVTLTDAQIKAWPTTPLEGIAAPGAGKFLSVLGGRVYSSIGADAGYDDLDADADLTIRVQGGSPELASIANVSGEATDLSLLLGSNSFACWILPPLGADPLITGWGTRPGTVAFTAASAENKPVLLVLSNGGDLTGGDPANALVVVLSYLVLDATTFAVVPA